MDPSGKSPHAEQLIKLGFIEVSDFRAGDIFVLDKESGKPERKLSEGQGLIAHLVSFALLAAHTMHPDEHMIYVNMSGIERLTGAYDYGHFWITGGHCVPEGFTQIATLIHFASFDEEQP